MTYTDPNQDHDTHVHRTDVSDVRVYETEERSAVRGVNLLTMLIALALLAGLLYWLFTGPLASDTTTTTPTYDNAPATSVPGVGTDSEPALVPTTGTGDSGTGTGTGTDGGSGTTP